MMKMNIMVQKHLPYIDVVFVSLAGSNANDISFDSKKIIDDTTNNDHVTAQQYTFIYKKK